MRIDVGGQAAVKAVLRLCNGDRWRQDYANGGSSPRGTLRFYPSRVRFYQVLDDGQAESGASLVAGTRGVGAIKPLEDAREVFGPDAGPRVPDFEHHALPGGRGPHRDGAAARSVAQGVVVQVRKDLPE